MRADSFGFFWEDRARESARGARQDRVRPIPPIPPTGWEPPKSFPRLSGAKLIGFDSETRDDDLRSKGPGVRRGAEIIGISVATEDRSWYFPMRHTMGENIDPEKVIQWAGSSDGLNNQIPKVGVNPLYDLDFFSAVGIEVGGTIYDVQMIEALLDENRRTYALDALANDYLGVGKNSKLLEEWIAEAYGVSQDFRADLWRAPSSLVGPYAEADAALPLQIFKKQLPQIRKQDLQQVFDIEVRLLPLLLAMRRRGVRVDLAHASEVDGRLTRLIQEDQDRLNQLAGREIGVTLPEDIGVLFDKLGLTYPRTPSTKKPSFTKEWLEHHPHPAAQLITAIRTWKKFQDTFIRGYIFDLNVGERLHCLFNQARGDEYGTVSGRFSSSLPNLQNIPHRDSLWGPLIRAAFVPEPGETWVKFDWSQIEFRILTHYGKGPAANKARQLYRVDPTADFHRMVANMTGVERGPAKNINFGLVYGMGRELLARQIGVDLSEAAPIFEKYHERFGFVRDAYNDCSFEARRDGYIKTLLGRRRRFDLWEKRGFSEPGLERETGVSMEAARARWGNDIRRAYTHKALNGRIQGSAADLMKKAMVMVWESGVCSPKLLGAPLLTVHDELDWSARQDAACREALREVKNIMESCIKLRVPIIAEREDGPNWGNTKKDGAG